MASATCSSLLATHGGSQRWSQEDIAQVDALMLQAEQNPIYMAERTGDRQRYLTEIFQTPAGPRLQASVDNALNKVVQEGWERIQWNKGYNLLHYFAERHKEPIALVLVSYLAPPGEIDRKDENEMRPIDYARLAAAKDPARQGVVDAVEAVRNRERQQSWLSKTRSASPPPYMRRTPSNGTSTTAGSPSGLHLSRSPSEISIEAIRNTRLKERIPTQQVIEQTRHGPELNVQTALRQRSCTPPAVRHQVARAASPAPQVLHVAPARHREARAASPARQVIEQTRHGPELNVQTALRQRSCTPPAVRHQVARAASPAPQVLHVAPTRHREARAASPARQVIERVPHIPRVDLEAFRQRSVTPPVVRHQERQEMAAAQQESRLPSQIVAPRSAVALHHPPVPEVNHARARDAHSDEADRWANRRGATPVSTPPSTPRSEVHSIFPDVQAEKQRQRELPPDRANRLQREEVAAGTAVGRGLHQSASEVLPVEAVGRQLDKEVWQMFLCEATRSGCTFEGGFTTLHLAAEYEDIGIAKAALEVYKEFDPRLSVLHQRDHKGRRPIDCASATDLEMLELLSPDTNRMPRDEFMERWRRGEQERGDTRQVPREHLDPRSSAQSVSAPLRTHIAERALREIATDNAGEAGLCQPLKRASSRSRTSGSSSESKVPPAHLDPSRSSAQSVSAQLRTQVAERPLRDIAVDHAGEPGLSQHPVRRVSWRSRESASSSESKEAVYPIRRHDASEPGAASLRPRDPEETAHFGGGQSSGIAYPLDGCMSEEMSSDIDEDEDNELPGHFGRPMTFDPNGDQ